MADDRAHPVQEISLEGCFPGSVRMPTTEVLNCFLSRNKGWSGGAEGAERINELALGRIKAALSRRNAVIGDGLLAGALSYLVEVINSLPDQGAQAQAAAVDVAGRFLFVNPTDLAELIMRRSASLLDGKTLPHLAKTIAENRYDWESLSIAFLDPEAAAFDRLRRNLALTPDQRWRRHQNFMRKVRSIRNANRRA